MYSVTCFAFCKCKNIKYSYQKVEPAFYSHRKNVKTNIKCSRFECPHCKKAMTSRYYSCGFRKSAKIIDYFVFKFLRCNVERDLRNSEKT